LCTARAGLSPAARVETMSQSLQDRFAPNNKCFGCGPANARGLRIKSFERDDEVVADWTPEAHHEAFPGMLNGGIIGALLDCHSNWTAAWHLYRTTQPAEMPSTVTAEFHVKMRKPTPSASPVHLSARVVESSADRATIEATLSSGGTVTATCRGVFVAVKPGHPAYHRWQ
jgi:acyl-coenzyme A thioesterase PaaI-like protein